MSVTILPNGETIINPLNTNKVSTCGTESTSAGSGPMDNTTVGQCPKCKGQMAFANAQQEPVYYCSKCRVTMPQPADL